MAKKKQTFEDSLARLEEITGLLETGDAPLAESVKLYQEGVTLAQFCAESLDKADAEIAVLCQAADGGFAQKPFAEIGQDDEVLQTAFAEVVQDGEVVQTSFGQDGEIMEDEA